MRSRRFWLIAALIVLVVGLIVAGALWFMRNYEQVENTLHLPPNGEAAYNPLYALGKTLKADGVNVQMRPRLALDTYPLGEHDTLLLFDDNSSLEMEQAYRLRDWVHEGGHLVIRTAPVSASKQPASPLLTLMQIRPLDIRSSGCVEIQGLDNSDDSHREFCGATRFQLQNAMPELAWRDAEGSYVYARLRQGRGRVDVLGDFDFLVNQNRWGNLLDTLENRPKGGLREAFHQAMARQILAPNYGQGTVHLVYSTQMPSLLRAIAFKGGWVWAPLLLAVLAWLWSRMLRFGPALPPPPLDRRSLLEHVRASGEHVFRYGGSALLYSAVRQAFLLRLRRRDPMLAALVGEAQATALAERLGVPIGMVRTALQAPPASSKPDFRHRISLLIQLRNRL